jgi:uncharacterized protein (TIGR03118 family)
MLFWRTFANGSVDVFMAIPGDPALTGNFTDPALPAGFAPFNIQVFGGMVYVTYAVQDPPKHDDVPGVGNGIVDIFDQQGNFVRRLISGGVLNSPWGLAMAPAGFGGRRRGPVGGKLRGRADACVQSDLGSAGGDPGGSAGEYAFDRRIVEPGVP